MNVPVETVLEYDIRKKRYITLYFKGYTGMRIRHFFPRIRIRLSWRNFPDPIPDPA